MRRFRTALILFVVLLGLGGLATWDEWQTKQDKQAEQTKNKITDFAPADVTQLYYVSKASSDDKKTGEPTKDVAGLELTAIKKDGAWRITRPVDVLADGEQIDNLIKTVTDYAYAKVITEDRSKWADFGLADPVRQVTFHVGGKAPQTLTVYLGNKAPVGYSLYFRTSKDDKVYMGSQHLLLSTAKSLFDFRDKSLLKIDEAKLKSLTYQAKGEPAIEMTKSGGKYAIVKPEKLEADSAAIRDFVDALNLVKVSSFIDTPDKATQQLFAAPAYTLTWQQESGESTVLKLVEKGGNLLAAFDPAQRVFGLPDDVKAKVKKDLTHFRDRRILDPDSLDVAKVLIDGDSYTNVNGMWYTAADATKLDDKGQFKGAAKNKPQEKSNIRAFIVDLEFAKTDRFIPLGDSTAKGLAGHAPEHRIVLSYSVAAKKPVTIDLYKSDDASKYLVTRTGATYVYQVAKTAFASMMPENTSDNKDSKKSAGQGPVDPTAFLGKPG